MKKTIYLLSFLFLISLSACGSSGGSSTPTYVGTWQFAHEDGSTDTWIFTSNTFTFSGDHGCELSGPMTVTGSNPWTVTITVASTSGCDSLAVGKTLPDTLTVSSDNKTMTLPAFEPSMTGTKQ